MGMWPNLGKNEGKTAGEELALDIADLSDPSERL